MGRPDPQIPAGNGVHFTEHDATGSIQGIAVHERAFAFRVKGVGQTVDFYGVNNAASAFEGAADESSYITLAADTFSNLYGCAGGGKYVIVNSAVGSDKIVIEWLHGKPES